MVLDAAKGIETQTRKLFEVCRLRDVPIITFINKLDREGREPFDLLDEIEQGLALSVTPASWPIGMGRDFLGCYDLLGDRLLLVARGSTDTGEICNGIDDPRLEQLLPARALAKLREDVSTVRALCPPFDRRMFLEGHLTPVFFGSAVNNFGVRELLHGLADFAPPPTPRPALERLIDPDEEAVTGFVFKIQANMDPKHRDRIAFVRLCSGHFKRGAKLKHCRSGKLINVHNPVMFLARERELTEEAVAGDIIGIPNHGQLRIGDGLSEGENLHFTGIPSFAPELLRRARPEDPMKTKHLGKALLQLAEEGAGCVFKPLTGPDWIVGVVGSLQFDVLADRIRTEYGVPVRFSDTPITTARWVEAGDALLLKKFSEENRAAMAEDHEGRPVFLVRNEWHLNRAIKDWPGIRFLNTREQTPG